MICEGNDILNCDHATEKRESIKNSENDYVEESIGATGYWQVGISILAMTSRYTALTNMTSIVFLIPVTDFQCTRFKANMTMDARNGTCYKNCDKYEYHSDAMETSLITDFGLICEKAWLGSFTQSLLMLGLIIGASFFGWISDRFGRRPALISSCFLSVFSMMPTAFAPDYWTFTTLRFACGFASGGTLMICLPIVIEIFGKRYREVVGTLTIIPDGVSVALLALFAYFLPKWNNYLFGFSVPSIFILILSCLIPESPRWLVSNGNTEQAIYVLTRAAKFNKRPTANIRDIVTKSVEKLKVTENETARANYSDFFKTKDLCITTLLNLFLWLVTGTNYYGIYMFLTLLDLDVFMIVALMGLIQLPLYPVVVILNKKVSRKISLFGIFLLCSTTMIILLFIPNGHWTISLFGVISFSACAICFQVLYVYAAELYPTTLRTMALGIFSAVCKLGALVAPFIANITPVWMPSIIFAVLSVIAALLVYPLPETKGRELKDVFD